MNDDSGSVDSDDGLSRPKDTQNDLTALAALFRRKWNPVIIHHLLDRGALGFAELEGEIDGISNKALSESLEDLENRGVIERTIVSERPFRVEYALTERGESLEPIIVAIRRGRVDIEFGDDD